jgi:hypothetical protein
MNMRLLAAAAASLAFAGPAFAADPAKVSMDLYALFSDACVANMATPDGVKTWAEQHRFEAIGGAAALRAFAGGEEGTVWEAKMPSGPFALALRTSGACAVYGDKLSPAVVEEQFGGFVDALRRSGRTVDVVKDDKAPGDHGQQHDLVYIARGSPSTLTVAMIANEKPGGLYQATLQISPPQFALPPAAAPETSVTQASAAPKASAPKHKSSKHRKRVSAPGSSK